MFDAHLYHGRMGTLGKRSLNFSVLFFSFPFFLILVTPWVYREAASEIVYGKHLTHPRGYD